MGVKVEMREDEEDERGWVLGKKEVEEGKGEKMRVAIGEEGV